MKIGLRVDVDTFRGTRDGVPNLCRLLTGYGIRATFFFSVGPDNMGRHLRRLIRPAFFAKMVRSKAGKLYGWDILLRGTIWPGPVIGKKLKPVIREAAQEGHEIGLHAWDHQAWQERIERMDSASINRELDRGFEMLSEINGAPPTCSAVPAWKCTAQALIEKQNFPFTYNSDCRGYSVFLPVVDGQRLNQPQVPVTLPTYDEFAGRQGVSAELFGDIILSLLRANGLNVFTIHAEVEGIAVKNEFIKFIQKTKALGHEFCALGTVLKTLSVVPSGRISTGKVAGREGWVSVQEVPGQ